MARFVAQLAMFTNEFGAWKVVDTDLHRMVDFYETEREAQATAFWLNGFLSSESESLADAIDQLRRRREEREESNA